MSFLSLGLKNDETHAGSEQSSANGNGHEPSGLLGLNVPRNGNGNHSSASIMAGPGDKDTGVAETVQREVTRTLAEKLESGESTVKPRFGDIDARIKPKHEERDTDQDVDDEERNALPPAIEALRRKLAGKGYKPQFRRVVSDGTPTFTTFPFGYLPGRGLLYSVIGHELILFGLFLLIHFGFPEFRSEKLISQLNSRDHIIYLPEMGGGKEGEKSPGGGASAPHDPSAAPAHASRGFAYPGKQAILSDPPNPTNAFQTLQRPLLVHPAPLNKLVPLPNIVQMSETRLPNELLTPKPAMPQFHPVPQAIKVKQDSSTHREAQFRVPTNDAPKLVAKNEMPKLAAAEQPLPDAPKVKEQPKQQLEEEKQEVEKPSPKPLKVTTEKRAEKPVKEASPLSQAQIARMEMHGKAPEPLLALSPMPLAPGSNVKIPNAEARGRFALAPGGTLNPNSMTPGRSNVPLSTTPGMGQDKSQAANAAAQVASNAGVAGHSATAGGGTGNSKDGLGSGSAGAGFGSGNTIGEGVGGNGNGKGRGNAGKGSGATAGKGAGTGSGGGSGPGSGAFQGITIQGGEGNIDNGGTASGKADTPMYTIAPQTAYNMTVVATASSGGGLEDYGVFSNEHVFTVYVPVKRAPDAEDPTWTLQYALAKEDAANPLGDQTVMAPSPVVQEWPDIPVGLVKRYAQRQVVVLAYIDKEGKISQISVKQTPDGRVSDPIIRALSTWVFRPAQLNNQPVAVKVLLGIPL